MAIGHLHVSAASARAALRSRIHGRSLALSRVVDTGPPPAVGAGARGSTARDGGVRVAAGDPDRPRSAVHGLARRDGIRAGAAARRDPAREEPAPAPADLGEDRALLEDSVGRALVAHGLRGLRGLRASHRPLRGRLQLPAAAPGARGAGPGGPVLPCRATRAGGGGGERRRQRAAARARAADPEALLPGGASRGPRPDDRGLGQRSAGPHG